MAGPLAGVKVVELAMYAAGPSAGAILADWGADVVKVESPEGDPFRFLATAPGAEEYLSAQQDNRGKRSISLDLGKSEGRQILHELVAKADVFFTTLRIGSLERLGFDWTTLEKRYPRLVYGILTGYGLTGPDINRPAFDIGTWWGRAGVAMSVLNRGSAPLFNAGAVGDHMTGLTLVAGICGALVSRAQTGRGQRVDVSMLRTGAFFISSTIAAQLNGGTVRKLERHEFANPTGVPFHDRDGRWFYLLALQEGAAFWGRLVRVLGRPEWADDPRAATPAARTENSKLLIGWLDEIFVTRTRAEWTALFDSHQIGWAPVQSVDELEHDPQMRAAGVFTELPTRYGKRRFVASPVDFSATPIATSGGSPAVGEHSREVLEGLGKPGEEVVRLLADRIAGPAR